MSAHEKLAEAKRLLIELSTEPALRQADRARMVVAATHADHALQRLKLWERYRSSTDKRRRVE